MSATIDHDGARACPRAGRRRRHGGPALLATFGGAPFAAGAARLAVEAAADMRVTLLVLDLVDLRPGRAPLAGALEPVGPTQAAALRSVAALAGELGVEIQSLALPSPAARRRTARLRRRAPPGAGRPRD
jgi:hypothetical protein